MCHKNICPNLFQSSFVIACFICLGSVIFTSLVICEESSQSKAQSKSTSQKTPIVPSNRDQYSGKIITSKKMGFTIVKFREANAPHVGEVAPGFTLKSASGNSEFSLSELRRNKPVVLIMASWGCDLFQETLPGLKALHAKYKDRANFVMIYTREIHSLDGFDEDKTARIRDPRTMVERMSTAMACRKELKLPFSILVDSIDDPVTTRWAALPVRIYVVGTDGKIAYAGRQGPWGYRPYRNYQHGDGELLPADLKYSAESLEEYLAKRFPYRPITGN